METKVFVFSVKNFEFFKFHEKEAKFGKCNFKKGLALAFAVKIC